MNTNSQTMRLLLVLQIARVVIGLGILFAAYQMFFHNWLWSIPLAGAGLFVLFRCSSCRLMGICQNITGGR